MTIRSEIESIDARAVIGARMKLRATGEAMKGLCPFHSEKKPSFVVYADGFKCFSCGIRGDVLDFICRQDHVSMKDGLKILRGIQPTAKAAKRPVAVNVERLWSAYHAAATPELVKGHANMLGVSVQSLVWLQAGWTGQSWAFPFRDENMKLVGLRFRENKDSGAKKWSLTGGEIGLFIPRKKIETTVYVCEGPTDAAAMLTLGFYAIGRPNANSKEAMLEAFLKNIKAERVILVTDNDTPKKRPDGSAFLPGLEGAQSFQKRWPTARIWLPPAKDIRAALRGGLTREDILKETL